MVSCNKPKSSKCVTITPQDIQWRNCAIWGFYCYTGESTITWTIIRFTYLTDKGKRSKSICGHSKSIIRIIPGNDKNIIGHLTTWPIDHFSILGIKQSGNRKKYNGQKALYSYKKVTGPTFDHLTISPTDNINRRVFARNSGRNNRGYNRKNDNENKV